MTTIAYDGQYLAIDSQLTAGGRKMTGTKLLRATTPDGLELVVCGCGTWSEIKKFVAWLEGSEEEPKFDEIDVLVAHSDGSVFQYSFEEPEDVTGTKVTLGSGSDYAMGALLSGKSAREAVAIASQCDLYTSGTVRFYDTQKPFKTTTKRIPSSKNK